MRGLLAIFFITQILANLDHLDIEVEYQCVQHCPLQNRTDVGHYDYACDYGCNIEQCAKGCKLWRRALNSSCQKACNGATERLTPKELYCVMGCNDALTKYFSQLRARLQTPPAPALVADSLNSTSLKLEWNFPEAKKGGLTCHVQWRYEELTATWQYCRNITWQQQDTVALIENLQPYTKYRFRIALILGHHGEPIVTAPSVVISTLPSGVPASPPAIVRAAPIDCTRISVSWEPGPFPHGPLLSYVLQITDNLQVHSEVKDIPPENNFYMFRNLRPSRNYTISIRMRNGVGSGPAARIAVSTPSEPLVKDTQQPVLILGTEHGVIEQGTDILDEPVILYSTLLAIKGIAIHVNRKLLFISDSGGYITKMPLLKNSFRNTSIILSPFQINFMPLDLSVDWLNNQLYILGEVKIQQQKMWQITRCNLDGKGQTVAVAGLQTKPRNIEVDPYNGYLFWVVQGYSKGGLYRLDLSHISNGIKHETQPEQILQDPHLGAFTVDHTNFRLLVSNQKQNTINTVSLDGKEITNLRPNVIKSKLQKVISLGTANKKFYWTDGDDVFYEEYHDSDDSYFHNSYPDLSARSYQKVLINIESAQPIPIPVNPPTNLQAIFGSGIAKTTWQAPHLLGIQGKGAWQNWSYEISLKEANSRKVLITKNINTTSCTIANLKQNTEYVMKAAAYTSFGNGPWSSEFRGVTLSQSKEPIIFWSAKKGLLKSDATGDNMETVIHKGQMKNFYFTDITWYRDQIYLVTNNSHVYWYNLESRKQGRLIDIDSVGSIAVDWIGLKLYWSNPKQQLIMRGNLNGTQQEPLRILTLAKELNIDSVKAYLYWSTGYAVECAHLNGADRMEYHHAQLFSGKQVMGLTLDMTEKFVYWIVRGSEGSDLFKAPMAGYFTRKLTVEKISSLQKPNMQGPLCYFHKKLLWLQDDRNAVISDLEGRNIATISGKSMSGLTMVYIIDSSLHSLPSKSKLNVIPDTIDQTSVRVVGSSNSFNVTWKPIENVNYGTVFYEVKIDSLSRNDSTVITTHSSLKYWQEVTPFTKLHVAIRAFTYWGTSPQIRAKIYSPPSTPSVPIKLRSYVTHQQNQNQTISITFRWNPPISPNGVLRGYKVHWCNLDNFCDNAITAPTSSEFILTGAEHEFYLFRVQAFTEIGDGELSDALTVNSSEESPLPTLLIASEDAIFIQDIDANHNLSLVHGINTPIQLSYLIRENKIFWINQLCELLMLNLLNSNKTKIIDFDGDAQSLTIDWLERSLYYVETNELGSVVTKIDLNHIDKGLIKKFEIFSTSFQIDSIEVSPFTKKLYWIENSKLMTCNSDGTEIKPFFNKHYHSKRDLDNDNQSCNCSLNIDVEKTFTIDHSNTNSKPILIFIDSATLNVVSTDKDGCFCHVVVNSTILGQFLPLERIKSDFGTLYWTSPDRLYTLKKRNLSIIAKQIKSRDILIFGPHMQPFPAKNCLTPKQSSLTAKLKSKTSSSLTILMPDYSMTFDCSNISMATVEYKISIMQQSDNASFCLNVNCQQLVTFNKEYTIKNLKPFTKYLVSVSISNFHSETEAVLAIPTLFQTAPGAPSKPQKVSVTVLNPILARISWLPPEQLNGAVVYYEIYRQIEGTLVTVPVSEQENASNLTALINKLIPNETYTIWVRAYSETNETFTDSERVQITTYPEPNEFVLLNNTAYSLKLEWKLCCHIEDYKIEFSPMTSNNWKNLNVASESETKVILVDNLKPKSHYKFRMILIYENYSAVFVWPPDSRFTFETLADKPSPPGVPIIQYIKPNIYKLLWEASKDNGSPILLYMLEGLQLPNYRNKRSTNRTAFFYTAPSIEEEQREWMTFYNGTETSWIINGLSEKYKYAFRVSALNSFGWSLPSEESTELDLNEAARMADKQNPISLIFIATFTPVSVFLLIIFFFCCRKYTKLKKVQVVSIPRGPDVELATLRELPRRGIHNTNVLYVSTQPTNDEITLLPHIRRDQITLMKFLGSGAFGEVFEGKAKLTNNETKVAVKTLRKGASDQEKTEFLQEAQLMSNFKHEHILQLLGVCLDNDPHFIIMELMQGGDLLTYLRSSRNVSVETPSLTLIELLKMCVDVAKGCRYLEEMHFVHRDLACRNCLVSTTDTQSRIVKIGDFGLARDIYKNDYYRKEGEGLLPVRWMAPESLVDGVFTSQSDVWAFGVLLWEIMTLGQQPYPARNNLEVLHYVRRGGRLGKPMDCPEALHSLMLKCWEFEVDKRPTFKYCLEILDNLHMQNLRNPTTGAHEGQYISTVTEHIEGISNEAYFLDENFNSGTSWIEDEASKEKTPFLRAQSQKDSTLEEIPKYLELLYEPDAVNDGYEIPNQIIQSESARKRSSSVVSLDSVSANKNKQSVNKVVNNMENLLRNNETVKENFVGN